MVPKHYSTRRDGNDFLHIFVLFLWRRLKLISIAGKSHIFVGKSHRFQQLKLQKGRLAMLQRAAFNCECTS